MKIALTFDVERDPAIKRILPRLLNILEDYNAVATYFIQHDYCGYFTNYSGRIAEKFYEIVDKCSKLGEIGSHVHFRRKNGKFCVDYDFQCELIENATNTLREKGFNVKAFRGGDLYFDDKTLQILEKLGYETDSTVSPLIFKKLSNYVFVDHQRVTSNKPYFPSKEDYCVSGDSTILEIPVTRFFFFPKRKFLSFSFAPCLHRVSGIRLSILKGWWKLFDNTPIIILYHPWSFLTEAERKIRCFKNFVEDCRCSEIEFVTMQQISSQWRARKF